VHQRCGRGGASAKDDGVGESCFRFRGAVCGSANRVQSGRGPICAPSWHEADCRVGGDWLVEPSAASAETLKRQPLEVCTWKRRALERALRF